MSIPMETNTISFLGFSFILSVLIISSSAIDTLSANQTIKDDGTNSTIISSGGIFELGFFSPGKSKNRYIGIWYKKISNRTVVWVANRNSPLKSTLGVFRLDDKGSIELMDATRRKIWSSNSSRSTTNPVVAQLLDTGNFAIRYEDNSDPENYLWHSFDFPGDNLLPGMKLGWNLVKGLETYVSSWKSVDDPSPGIFVQRLDLSGYPQLFVFAGSDAVFRYGPWDGIQFSGVSFFRPDIFFELKLISTKQEIYSTFELNNNSTTAVRFVLQPDGNFQLLTNLEGTQNWIFGSYDQDVLWDYCDQYAFCGAYGSCNITQARAGQQACSCLKGYQPRFAERWNVGNWSDGCVRKTQFACKNGSDVFVKYPGLKLPDTRTSLFNQTMGLDECKEKCTKNCSCTAYSNVDIRQGGTGCLLWFNELMDLRNYKVNGLDLFVRTAASELVQEDTSSKKEDTSSKKSRKVSTGVIVIICVSGVALVLVVRLLYLHLFKKRRQRRKARLPINLNADARNETEREDLDLPLFDFNQIANATDNFCQNNKLGEGGFGPVYKGTLDEGQEIAVKRLSKTSRQGIDEFKNEVSCIAKLQHRNLVRLLGCCIEEGEMLLIYEYMPNRSLDSFIFDKVLSKKLDWPKRNNIINGTAKGLLYLHQDSRLRIIHRDLKAGNILLDGEMNPRISDFGLARTFGGNESAVNTARVVGTYGYMSPEYAIDGLFSVKSDAYSFGVVILEIVSGKKIRGFYNPENNLNLLGHAWKLFKEGKFMDLVDESIVETCKPSEVLRAIHIGLLCVQPFPKDRPNMPFIVAMLASEAELPEPKQPGFFTERGMQDSDSSSSKPTFISNDELTVTFFAPR